MKIGFLLPGNYGLAGPGNGVREQALQQALALEGLGHTVVRLNPWEAPDLSTFDVIQYFFGGYAHHRIEERFRPGHVRVFAPMIDSNTATWIYRLSSRINMARGRITTLHAVYRQQALTADAVIARSCSERDRLIYGLGVSRKNVHTVLNGVTPPPQNTNVPSLSKRFHIPEEFALFVGNYTNPRKNVDRLIDAVGPTEFPLIIAGSFANSDRARLLKKKAARYGTIQVIGWVSPAERDWLYSRCRVFCLPSLHEGTGLAALEAAASGANVVVTSRGGPPDYFKDMAEYVNPRDVRSIREAITSAWQRAKDDTLQQHVRQHLTWTRSARQLATVYEHAHSKPT